MRYFRYTALLFLVSLVLFSCQKERLGGDKKILVGTWSWKYSDVIHYCNGYGEFELYNPESEDATYQIIITKMGKLSFLKNGEMLSEHKIRVDLEYISESGTVESNRKILAYIILDGDETNKRRFKGTQKEMSVQGFPITSTIDCEVSAVNFFTKIQ